MEVILVPIPLFEKILTFFVLSFRLSLLFDELLSSSSQSYRPVYSLGLTDRIAELRSQHDDVHLPWRSLPNEVQIDGAWYLSSVRQAGSHRRPDHGLHAQGQGRNE
jgi:hypothetical protein